MTMKAPSTQECCWSTREDEHHPSCSNYVNPLPGWEEGVTLVQSQFTRAIEIREYAQANTGGDIAAAIIELVNTGLSHG